MLKTNVSTNINGQSIITDSNGEKQVAYMNATVDKAKSVNINKSIQNIDLFNANKAAVQADFTEFENFVYSMVESGQAK